MIKFKFTERDTEGYKNWFTFYPKRDNSGFNLTLNIPHYFDPRPQIVTSLSSLLIIAAFIVLGFSWWSLLLIPCLFFSWGQLFINLPWDTKDGDTCEYKTYGVNFYSVDGETPNHIWIRLGDKTKSLYMPWAFDWYRTSVLMADMGWLHDTKKDRVDLIRDNMNKYSQKIPYRNTLKSGKVQEVVATVTVGEREWRRYYTPFTKLLNKVDRYIDIDFSEPIGERVNSWKGGTVGCSYTMLEGETALECLKRMEANRKF